MQALLIFFAFFFFLCSSFIFVLAFYFSFFLSKVLQNQNTIQTNQQISYQPDTDSLLNITKYCRADLTI
jgi:hypothetical protein